MRIPDFLIIGAAKAGTTTMYEYLVDHPQLFMSTPKEPEFFARTDKYEKGVDNYASLFASASPDQLCGEASPIYTLAPHFPAAKRIARHAPQAKLIYLLREPVARTYSVYTQFVKNYQNATRDYRVHRSFEECIFPEEYPDRAPRDKFFAPFDAHYPDHPGVFLDASNYPLQIKTYLEWFPHSQMLFLTFDEFIASPHRTIERICRFLGVASLPQPAEPIASNVSADYFNEAEEYRFRAELKEKHPAIIKLAAILPTRLRKMISARVTALARNTVGLETIKPRPMTDQTRTRLEGIFDPQIRETETLTGLDLTCWRKTG